MIDTISRFRLLHHAIPQSPLLPVNLSATVAVLDLTIEAGAAAAGPLVFHTVEEVARALDVSPKTIRRRILDGGIRKVPMGGRLVRISSTELQRLAAAGPLKPAAPTQAISIS